MVEAVRAGAARRAVARQFGVSLPTVQRWVARAGTAPLAAVDWSDRPPTPHRQPRRTPPLVEAEILRLRTLLRAESPLGEYGAAAIRRALGAGPTREPLPTARTIGRVLARRGALDPPRRIRRPAPPRGWYLPAVAAGTAELDAVDTIVGLRLAGGVELEILTCISLHGGLPGAWVRPPLRSEPVIAALSAHWAAVGRPGYAQFDNAMIFAGSQGRPDLGRVARLCLGLGITPVFVPPREMGFQAAVESFNGRWQAKVWRRLARPGDLAGLQRASAGFIAAARARAAARIAVAPARAPWPKGAVAEPATPAGQVIYLRRTDAAGAVRLLRQRIPVDPAWPHRLVRVVCDLDARQLRCYALQRRTPEDQPLLASGPFDPPWPRHG